MKEEMFPHIEKSLTGENKEWRGFCGALEKAQNKCAEGKKQREICKVSVPTEHHYSETLVHWLTALGGDDTGGLG